MTIPFRDPAGNEPNAAVAYLRFLKEPVSGGIRGGLFVTSSRGEPLEFCFTRVEPGSGPLWEPDQAYRGAVTALAKALFNAASHLPDLVLALAEETPSEVFTEDVVVQVPVCLVGALGIPPNEESPRGDLASLDWIADEPSEGSALARLVETLRSRRLLLEPLERAAKGMAEAFADR